MNRRHLSLALAVIMLLTGSTALAAPRDDTPPAIEIAAWLTCPGTQPAEPALDRYCRRVVKARDRYRSVWLAKAGPFLQALVPADAGKTVVYPFGGADLLNALAVFPDAGEITTLSLEAVGPPTTPQSLSKKQRRKSLRAHGDFLAKLMKVNHNRTIDLEVLNADALSGPLVFALFGLSVHQRELVHVRYFTLGDDGAIHYLQDVDASPRFDHVEIAFRRPDGPVQVFRHIYANLDDTHLAATPGVIAHLEAKGQVTAMTKAASYLLWRRSFSTIRTYLLTHMRWMVSDSSGINPTDARAAGFEQSVWGRFDGAMFHAPKPGQATMAALFKGRPYRKLGFYFGYPDVQNRRHLVVTRRAAD
ncbi:MAG: hypothetical protein ACI9MR_000407 [Myxococcota bacterium]|jgi:hypothetical protein